MTYLLASASFSILYLSASAGRLMVASSSRSLREISCNMHKKIAHQTNYTMEGCYDFVIFRNNNHSYI